MSQIAGIVSDNDANIVNACDKLKEKYGWVHVRCAAHTLELCLKEAFHIPQVKSANGTYYIFCKCIVIIDTEDFAYNDFGYNDSSPITTFFADPGKIPIIYVHLSLVITTSVKIVTSPVGMLFVSPPEYFIRLQRQLQVFITV